MIQEKASPKISVIVPVYNPGNGFARCLKSLQEQTLTDFEVIFIDDCSTDDSIELARDAAKNDKRIRILVNEQNSGAGYSRNRGIEEACGEYLAFVDPDDFIANDFLQLLYKKTIDSKPDIVKGEKEYVNAKGMVADAGKEQLLNESIREGLTRGLPLYRLFLYNHWTAIYKRQFIMDIGARYGLTRNSQDSTFLLRTCYYTKNIDFEDSAKYYYAVRTDSRVRDYSRERLQQELLAFEDFVKFFHEHEIDGHFYPYIIGKIEYLLRVQAWIDLHYSKADGEWFLNEIRDAAKSLPNVSVIQFMSLKMEILIKYGTNLSSLPYRMQGEEPDVEDRYDVAKRWTDFLCTHSEYTDNKKYNQYVIQTYVSLLSSSKLRSISLFKRYSIYNAARQQLRRLTSINWNISKRWRMYTFIHTGINVFQINERIGKCIYIVTKKKNKAVFFTKKKFKHMFSRGNR